MYKTPSLCVDAIVVNANKEILLIQRGHEPFVGKWAFPGGRVDYGEEPANAVVRELVEETGLLGSCPKLFGVYGEPSRDPRTHNVSIVYQVEVEDITTLNAGDDAKEAVFWSVEKIRSAPDMLAFDHSKIIADFLAINKHLE